MYPKTEVTFPCDNCGLNLLPEPTVCAFDDATVVVKCSECNNVGILDFTELE